MSKWRNLLTVRDFLLDLLYPPRCVACGDFGSWLCATCLATVPELGMARNVALPGRQLLVYSVSEHVGVLRQASHKLKYENFRVLAAPLAALMADRWQRSGLNADCLVAVPLHKHRQASRGYNQSELLACELGRLLGIPLLRGAVTRVRNTRAQVGLSLEERRTNVSGAFSAGAGVAEKKVVLVDDVCTTGATLTACASAIEDAKGYCLGAITLTQAALADLI